MLQSCGACIRDARSPVGAFEPSAWSNTVSVAVGNAVTIAAARCTVPDGAAMLAAPEWAIETTRRLPSPVGVSDGA
jgi:hypothetical protein